MHCQSSISKSYQTYRWHLRVQGQFELHDPGATGIISSHHLQQCLQRFGLSRGSTLTALHPNALQLQPLPTEGDGGVGSRAGNVDYRHFVAAVHEAWRSCERADASARLGLRQGVQSDEIGTASCGVSPAQLSHAATPSFEATETDPSWSTTATPSSFSSAPASGSRSWASFESAHSVCAQSPQRHSGDRDAALLLRPSRASTARPSMEAVRELRRRTSLEVVRVAKSTRPSMECVHEAGESFGRWNSTDAVCHSQPGGHADRDAFGVISSMQDIVIGQMERATTSD